MSQYDKTYLRRVVQLRRSDVYKRTMTAVLSDANVASALGCPIEAGLPTGGITDLSQSSGVSREVFLKYLEMLGRSLRGLPPTESIAAYAHFTVPISGPSGSAKVVVVATESSDGWDFHWVQAQFKSGELIDLRC
jgi:hypothetical protein